MTNYELLALDLDGTLTNQDKVITPKTKTALLEMQERGKRIVLASGRPTEGVWPLARELKLNEYGGYLLAFNGAVIIDCRTGETLFSRLLPARMNRKIIRLGRDYQTIVITYSEDGRTILTEQEDNLYVRRNQAANRMQLRQVDDLEAAVTYSVPKFLMIDEAERLAAVEPLICEALGEDASVCRSAGYYLEIAPSGINKAKSLERLLTMIGLERQQLAACGDGYNDISMLQFAGLGVAMANAVQPVKMAADYITSSNNEDGIAQIVEKFMI